MVSAGRTRSGTKTPLYGGVLTRTSSCARARNDPRAEHLAIVSLSSESGFRLTKNRRSPAVWFLLLIATVLTPLSAQVATKMPMGIAWQVQGSWHLEGDSAAIVTGATIPPGALLQPVEESSAHSITVLLPDGQRILYECFTITDCARGFRVPSLYDTPDPFAVDMLARIHAVMMATNEEPQAGPNQGHGPAREGIVAELGPANRITVAGLVSRLPDGHYTGDLRSLDRKYPREPSMALEKSAPSIALALPGPGLYDLRITDDLNNPRVDLLIAAANPQQASPIKIKFEHAQRLLEKWNDDYQGWPVSDFQRIYLESLMLGIKPLDTSTRPPVDKIHIRSEITSEPRYFPRPGVFERDTSVTLRCATPGAVIHYTVDNSQPVNESPIYSAPIAVNGTELTIKAFASAPGRKDSPVVTGIFRIKE
jgi:Chitobiase/beta-hexosaminidase C-terminal domain